mmetsp:Transcript_35282/g.77237  ORF Transcript_35282/g.77237 Transcript_35282/m.77237 type:complete len:219 (-) Transcript_35282:205-861(-)
MALATAKLCKNASRATDTAVGKTSAIRPQGRVLGSGSPLGTSPTIATPESRKFALSDAKIKAITKNNASGNRFNTCTARLTLVAANRNTIDAKEMAIVGTWAWSTSITKCCIKRCTRVSRCTWMPTKLSSCDNAVTTAAAEVKPDRTGWLTNRATQSSRSTPIATMINPTAKESNETNATYSCCSSTGCAKFDNPALAKRLTIVDGPTETLREVPNSA